MDIWLASNESVLDPLLPHFSFGSMRLLISRGGFARIQDAGAERFHRLHQRARPASAQISFHRLQDGGRSSATGNPRVLIS
jgi:hypothetical protein